MLTLSWQVIHQFCHQVVQQITLMWTACVRTLNQIPKCFVPEKVIKQVQDRESSLCVIIYCVAASYMSTFGVVKTWWQQLVVKRLATLPSIYWSYSLTRNCTKNAVNWRKTTIFSVSESGYSKPWHCMQAFSKHKNLVNGCRFGAVFFLPVTKPVKCIGSGILKP